MDIKSKKYKVNLAFRRMAFLLCVIFFISAFVTGAMALKTTDDIYGAGMDIDQLLYYPNYIKSGGIHGEFASKTYELLNLMETIGGNLNHDNIRHLQKVKEGLDSTKGFVYYATDGVSILSNLPAAEYRKTLSQADFKNMAGRGEYLIYSDGKMSKTIASEESLNSYVKYNDRYIEDDLNRYENPDLKIYIAFQESYIANKEEMHKTAKEMLLMWLPIVLASTIVALFCLIYLIVTTGRKDEEGNRPYRPIDKIYTEIQLAVIALCLFGGGYLFISLLYDSLRYTTYHFGSLAPISTGMLLELFGAIIIGLASASVGLFFILSTVRNLKSGRFLKNLLVYRIVVGLWRGVCDIYNGGSLMRKIVLLALATCLLSATVFLAPVVFILILLMAPKWIRKYQELRKGLSEVRNGNLTYKIPVTGDGELDQLAAEINEISKASNIAIQNELKNQRLKTELISNVSHDLKTPLTSIITYIDLLKTEGLDGENAPRYLEVLDQKTLRLQKLTEDLFDAAKASSGAIPMNIENVDLLSLINQGLGEMAARIEASNLEFIVNAKDERYYVHADGQLLWRVVENLLGNVLKYALQGSRVYMDLKEVKGINGKDGQVLLEIKNISKAELNINADELMERFKRGDESRSTEGSGLGLAIAKDLVLLQKGWFEVKIDGDLFKAIVMLPKGLPAEQEQQREHSEE